MVPAMRRCSAHRCRITVPDDGATWMCAPHWARVPSDLQRALRTTTGQPFLAAMIKAIRAVRDAKPALTLVKL